MRNLSLAALAIVAALSAVPQTAFAQAAVTLRDGATNRAVGVPNFPLYTSPANGPAEANALGPVGSVACRADTGFCSINALLQRLAQRLTTIATGVNGLASTEDVRGNQKVNPGGAVTRCVVPVITASSGYGANYEVGPLLIFQNMFGGAGSGFIQTVTVNIKDVEASGFVFLPLAAQPSAGTTLADDTVLALAAADKFLPLAPVTNLSPNSQWAATLQTTYSATGLGEFVNTIPPSPNLYAVLAANATLTNNLVGTQDVQVCVTVVPDP
jgi:hypothetical protein